MIGKGLVLDYAGCNGYSSYLPFGHVISICVLGAVSFIERKATGLDKEETKRWM